MASLGTWPASILPMTARFVLQTNQRVNASPGGGSEQVLDMLNDRWMAYVTLPVEDFAQAAAVEAFLASFRGMVNTVDLWHFARPVPRGTISGSPTLSASAAAGANQIQIATSVGATLLAGDMVGVSGLLLMCAADATANGSGVLTMTTPNRLRKALSSGAAVTLSQPKVPFRLLSHSGVQYERGISSEVDLVLGEAI